MIAIEGNRIASLVQNGQEISNVYVAAEDILPYLFLQTRDAVLQPSGDEIVIDMESNVDWTVSLD